MAATRANGKAGHMSDIMFICNQFKEARRTIRPTNALWAYLIGNEKGTSTSVELPFRGYWDRFSSKVFED